MDEKFQKAKEILNSMTNAIYKQYFEKRGKRDDSVVNCFVFNNRSYSVNYWHLR